MPRQQLFRYNHIETALCLFENFLDTEHTMPEERITRVFQDLRGNVGSYEVRRIMHELAIPAEKMWSKTLTPDERSDWTFDWEFCPAFLYYGVQWEGKWLGAASDIRPKLFTNAWTRMKACVALRREFGSTKVNITEQWSAA